MAEQEIICIGCPLGCRVTLKVGDKGELKGLVGHQCKEGKEYVIHEFEAPARVFTSTVLTEGGGRLLPVRTDKPIPKSHVNEVMRAVAKVRVKPPVKTGQVIIPNILGTGADLLATGSL